MTVEQLGNMKGHLMVGNLVDKTVRYLVKKRASAKADPMVVQ